MKIFKKRKTWIWIGIIVVVIVILASVFGGGKKAPVTAGADATTGTEAGATQAEETKTLADDEIQVFGEVKAKKIYNVNVEFPVKIKKIEVATGAIITEGTTVAELDMEKILQEYNDKVTGLADDERNRTENLEYEKNMYEQVKTKLIQKQAEFENKETGDLSQKLLSIENAKAELDRQKEKFNTTQELYNLQGVSDDEYKDAKLALDQKEKTLKVLKMEYDSLVNSKRDEIADLNISLLTHKKTISDLANKNFNDQKTAIYNLKKKIYENQFIKGNKIISDVKRGLVEQMFSDGAYVEEGAKILNIYDLDTLYVEAYVPEEFYNNIKEGNKVKLVPVADKSKEYTGTITKVPGLAVKNSSEVQIPVEIVIDNLDSYLIPNLNMDVYLK